jgi:hypothetical protein
MLDHKSEGPGGRAGAETEDQQSVKRQPYTPSASGTQQPRGRFRGRAAVRDAAFVSTHHEDRL